MIRKGRVPSRVLWHTWSVLGQEGPGAIEFACGLRANRNRNRTFWTFSSRNGGVVGVAQPLAFGCMAFSVQLVGDSLEQGMHHGVSLPQMCDGASTKGKGT